MSRRLYLDLDGVLADFDAYFPQLFGVDHRALADELMWSKINSHPSYFRSMPMCVGAKAFFEQVKHLDPSILTACPKSDYANVAKQKRGWVREHLSTWITILPVQGGSAKPLFMNQPGDVLVDDFERNCTAWTAAGGIAIHHTGDFAKTLARIWDLF